MTGPTRWAWIVSIDVAGVANAKAGEARPSTKGPGFSSERHFRSDLNLP